MVLMVPLANHSSDLFSHRMDRLQHFVRNIVYHNLMLAPTFQFLVLWPLSCFQVWRLHTHVILQPLSMPYNSDTELSAAAGGVGGSYDYNQSSLVVLLLPSSCLLSIQHAGCGEEGG
jgi:hypothetical protein